VVTRWSHQAEGTTSSPRFLGHVDGGTHRSCCVLEDGGICRRISIEIAFRFADPREMLTRMSPQESRWIRDLGLAPFPIGMPIFQ